MIAQLARFRRHIFALIILGVLLIAAERARLGLGCRCPPSPSHPVRADRFT
jgi:hypothetical protein